MPWDFPQHFPGFPGRATAPCSESVDTTAAFSNSNTEQQPVLSNTIRLPCSLPTACFPLFYVVRYSLHHEARLALSRAFLVSCPNAGSLFLVDISAGHCQQGLLSPQGLLSQYFHLTHPVMFTQAAAAMPPLELWDPSIKTKPEQNTTESNTACPELSFSAMCCTLQHCQFCMSSKSYYSGSKQGYMSTAGTVHRHSSPLPDVHIPHNFKECHFLTGSKTRVYAFIFESGCA